MSSFKPGDTVQMKSGGPIMTIEKIDGEKALCHWFGEKNKQESGFFPIVVLELHDFSSGFGVA